MERRRSAVFSNVFGGSKMGPRKGLIKGGKYGLSIGVYDLFGGS